jgi:Glycine cleavage system T protein (aminomethyltransferase)
MTIGQVSCLVQRLSYTGDLGYEIYCHPMDQRALWSALWQAGEPHGIAPFGMRAMMSLRLDRFFGAWLHEFSPDYTAAETGIDRFIQWSKEADFIGRAVAEAERITPPDRTLLPFEVDAAAADVTAYEPIFIDGEVKGFCTSGGYSHHTGKSIAFGLVPRDMAQEGLEVEIEILGQRRAARYLSEPIFDPEGTRFA